MARIAAVWFQAVHGPCCLLRHSPFLAEAAPAMTSLTVLMGYRMLWPLKSAVPSLLLNLRQARLRLCILVSAIQEAHALLSRDAQLSGEYTPEHSTKVGDVIIESIELVVHVTWWVGNMFIKKKE